MSRRAKVSAFFQEFPFLGNLLNEDQVDWVHVERVDQDLLAKAPIFQNGLDAGGDPDKGVWDMYLILDKNGKKLASVGVRPAEKKWWRYFTWSGEVHFQETIGDAIARLRWCASEVVYFVLLFETYNGAVTLYKPPKKFTIQGWLEEEIRLEQTAIREKLQAIDVLAQQ